MTDNQRIWQEARDRLVQSIRALGFTEELGSLIAQQLGSPRAIDRMNAYVRGVRPTSEEIMQGIIDRLNHTVNESNSDNSISDVILVVPIGTGYAYRHHPFFSKFKEVKAIL